ncbi:MAG: FAD-dependent oxidoreductase [Chitinophagaceae bacterium]
MIERDGQLKSLWQQGVQPYTTLHTAIENQSYDVIVVGGGITGLSTALLLQEAGKKCLVLEAKNLCFGTTGGTTAHLNTLLDTPYTEIEKKFSKETSREMATAAAAALDLVKRNIEQYNISCGFAEASACLFAQNSKQQKELEEIAHASAAAGLQVELTTDAPPPFRAVKTLRAMGQAKFHPVNYVYGLAKAFESLGGVILQQCQVTDVQNKDGVICTTGKGNFIGRDLIYATHIPPGINLLHLRCAPYRTYAMAVKLEDGQSFNDLVYDMEDPYHYYRSQIIDGTEYLIAGGKDHKTGQEENPAYRFTSLEATVRSHFKFKDIACKWSSQYFESTDGLPYIGHLPGHAEHIYTATGFGGNGMTYSHLAARLLADILLENENPLIKVLSPARIKPVAGFTNFITHNADAVRNFAGKLFSGEKLQELAGIAPGEGKIVQYDGEKIGLVRDKDGQLHAVKPVCTHLQCEVKWNGAEQSWECPCHGARYNCEGKVITGPAVQPLEKIDLGSKSIKPQTAT